MTDESGTGWLSRWRRVGCSRFIPNRVFWSVESSLASQISNDEDVTSFSISVAFTDTPANMMKFALLVSMALAASASADPVYQEGTMSYTFDKPVNLDISGALTGIKEFKTGLAAQLFAIAQPAAIFFVAAFVVYVFASLAFQIAFALFNGKLSLFAGLWTILANFNSALLGKFKGALNRDEMMDGEVAADIRAKRNAAFPTESQLMNLLSGLADAMEKFD